MANRKKLRDFRGYGNLEALNAILLPAVAAYYGWPGDRAAAGVLILALAALVTGLVVGAVYWWALAKRIAGNAAPMHRALRLADLAQRPMLLVVIAAGVAATWQLIARGLSFSPGIAAGAALLAALEYVNYYHVQLQHFDNAADWRRLLGAAGFRRAHMARDLAAWRRGGLAAGRIAGLP